MTTDTNNGNEQDTPTPPDLPKERQAAHRPVRVETNALASLLKSPEYLMQRIEGDENLTFLTAQLLFWGLIFHAVYGFAMALFDSSGVALMTAGKAPLAALCSLALCLPSLYVFSCVAGMPVKITQALALAGATLAMTGILLLGLTPVAWLFSVSTNNLAFVVIVNLAAWSIAIFFSLKFFSTLTLSDNTRKATGLRWWLVVYIIVSLQMITTMRPLLGTTETGWREPEKKFFLTHFKESISAPKNKPNPSPTR